MSEKPILFNTDMVRAIMVGRKTVTRRIVKHDVDKLLNSPYHKEHPEVENKQIISKLCLPPYQPGDILYVRETWSELSFGYVYKADGENIDHLGNMIKWHPSIHMPKEAARIWLKVKDVRVERLQDVKYNDCIHEGLEYRQYEWEIREYFQELWDSTIKKSDIEKYGWAANPWVWVVEFERCEKTGEENECNR